MLKLMKYEFRKTLFTKLILLGITAIAEVCFLAGLGLDDEKVIAMSIAALVFLAIGGIMVIGLESVLTLHRDMNTKQSYMLFMTPNSCYSILGAKVVETSASILLAGLFFFALGVLDITLLFSKMGELNDLWLMIQDLIHAINDEVTINTQGVASLLFGMLCNWINVISAVFLADVVSAALLYGKKHNGLVSFLLFLLISGVTGWITQKVTGNIPSIVTTLIVQGLINLGFAVIMYFATAQIMERKLSV